MMNLDALITEANQLVTWYGDRPMPDIRWYLLVLLAYVCILLPGSYYTLSKLKKLYLYKRVVMAIALILTVVIFVIGSYARYDSASFYYAAIRQYSETEASENDEQNSLTMNLHMIYVKYQVPYNGDSTIVAKNDYALIGLDSPSNYMIDREHKNQITFLNVRSFDQKMLLLDRKNEKQNVSDSETLHLIGMESSDGFLNGTIVNNTSNEYENVIVVHGKQAINLGRLPSHGLIVLGRELPTEACFDEEGAFQQQVLFDKLNNRTMEMSALMEHQLKTKEIGVNQESGWAIYGFHEGEQDFIEGDIENYGITMDVISFSPKENGGDEK